MTLRQEIEKLISDLTKVHIERIDHPNDYVRGRGDGIELAVDNITDILSRHTEPEHTAPSQRERIATACMAGITSNPNFKASTKTCAEAAVTAADALIAELSKTDGHVRP